MLCVPNSLWFNKMLFWKVKPLQLRFNSNSLTEIMSAKKVPSKNLYDFNLEKIFVVLFAKFENICNIQSYKKRQFIRYNIFHNMISFLSFKARRIITMPKRNHRSKCYVWKIAISFEDMVIMIINLI